MHDITKKIFIVSKKDYELLKSIDHSQRIYRMIGMRSFGQMILVYTDRSLNMAQSILGEKPANIADAYLSSSDRTGVNKTITRSNTATTSFLSCYARQGHSHKRVSSGWKEAHAGLMLQNRS
ncbi:MAG TPA: hypothetical protein DCE14_08755 [Kosmotogaceae bacterium]|nr:hypothetical protein [Kosmotogaceae bacterium]